MKVTAYIGEKVYDNRLYKLIIEFFSIEGIMVEEIQDTRQLMLLTKGIVHPAFGFVIMIQGKEHYHIYDVVKTIEQIGMRKC